MSSQHDPSQVWAVPRPVAPLVSLRGGVGEDAAPEHVTLVPERELAAGRDQE